MPCSRDNNAHCGSGWRNLIYDLENLGRKSQVDANKAKALANCKKDTDGKVLHIECTKRGGYLLSDPCNQTCRAESDMNDKDVKMKCIMKCDDETDFNKMYFKSNDEREKYRESCV